MKVLIVGGGCGKTTLVEKLIEEVENMTGEKVSSVNIHSKEKDFLTQKIDSEPIVFSMPKLIEPTPHFEPKIKGHIRPYKYHS